ncbi:MAG: hypothetical protein ACYCXW_02040 [Solirubrobacteraceae bacterium]
MAGLFVVLAAAALLLAGCGSGSHKTTRPIPLEDLRPNRAGPVTMFTAPGVGDLTPANLQLLKSLGVDYVQVYMHWADIAPNPTSRHKPPFNALDPAAYPASQWASYDTAFRELAAMHLELNLALIPPPPLWAQGRNVPRKLRSHPQWEPNAAWYGQWVHAVGVRYSGHYTPAGQTTPLPRVNFWSIWNEPNLGNQLAPQTVDHGTVAVAPRHYRALVDAAWHALTSTGHGSDRILIGELAPSGQTKGNGPGNFGMTPGLAFLRTLYCVDSSFKPLTGAAASAVGCPATAAASARFRAENPGLFDATGFADHPYTFDSVGPNLRFPNEPDYTNLAAIPNLESTLDRLQQVYGSSKQFPIWSTEYGYLTNPPDGSADAVPQQTAAYYLNWAEYLTWLDPRIRSYDQYELQDPPKTPQDPNPFASGLLTAANAPKPAFYAFRMPIFLPVTSTAAGQPLLVWGGARAAPLARRTTHRQQSVEIQFRARGATSFKTIATVSLVSRHGYFETRVKFPSSGQARLAWTPPQGATQYSRTVTVTLH